MDAETEKVRQQVVPCGDTAEYIVFLRMEIRRVVHCDVSRASGAMR
jgi:hypothetical protein